MAYTLTQGEFRALKARLTRAKNSKDYRKVIAECDRALDIFENKGYPDNWADWERAKADAQGRLTLGIDRW